MQSKGLKRIWRAMQIYECGCMCVHLNARCLYVSCAKKCKNETPPSEAHAATSPGWT